MTPAEVSLWGKSLLLKIHVITGWTIPASELMNILVDQFQKKLIETYPNVNPEEIEYAFRNFGTHIQDWGKAMNLALIDSVMIPYLEERKRLSHAMEERSSPPPEQELLSDEQLDNIVRGDIEAFYQRCRSGQIPPGIPDYFREILEKDGIVEKGADLSLFFSERLNKGIENIYVRTEA